MKTNLGWHIFVLKPQYVVLVDLNEVSKINLSKSATFSLQTSENNLKPP